MPLLYAGLSSINYLWLLSEPFQYLIKGQGVLGIAPRWLEVGITLLMIGGIYLFLELSRQAASS